MTSASRWLCSVFHVRKFTFLRSFFSWNLSCRITAGGVVAGARARWGYGLETGEIPRNYFLC